MLYDRMADRVATAFTVMVGVFGLAMICGVGYVVVHFVVKYW